MFNVMLVTTIIQIGNFSIQPLLSLYVAELTDAKDVAFLAGITFSAAGLGNLLFARRWGRLGDDIGYEKVLSILLLLSFVFVIPQAFVTELWQLMIFRLLFGIAVGGMIPLTTALVRREAPLSIQGEVMGYNTSFRFLGQYYRTYVRRDYQWIYRHFFRVHCYGVIISSWIYFPLYRQTKTRTKFRRLSS